MNNLTTSQWIIDQVSYCQNCGKNKGKPKLITRISIWVLMKMGMSKEEIVNQLRKKMHGHSLY